MASVRGMLPITTCDIVEIASETGDISEISGSLS